MKKTILFTALAFATLGTLTSCSGREDEPTPEPAPKITKSDTYGTWKATHYALYFPHDTNWRTELDNRTLTVKPDGTFTTSKFPDVYNIPYKGVLEYKQDQITFDMISTDFDLDITVHLTSKTTAEAIEYNQNLNPTKKWKLVKQ